MFSKSKLLQFKERIADSNIIWFSSLEQCRTVRLFNGPDNEKHREIRLGMFGEEKALDKSYQHPDYMNLVGLAEQLFCVNGVESVIFSQYSIRIESPSVFDVEEVCTKCEPIIETWLLTRSLSVEE